MSETKGYLGQIITSIDTLGYTFTDEFFNFENVPASGSDNLYRAIVDTMDVAGYAGQRIEKSKRFTLWFAVKPSGADKKAQFYGVLDKVDGIEDALLTSMSNVQLNVNSVHMSPLKSGYVVLKVKGEVIYCK